MTPQDTAFKKSGSSASEWDLNVDWVSASEWDLNVDWVESGKRLEVKPLPQDSAAGESVVLFAELAGKILGLFDRVSGLAEVRDEPEGVHVKSLLSDYLERLKERLTEKTGSSASPVIREIDYDSRVHFGLSKASVRELWDNEEDEFWNDV